MLSESRIASERPAHLLVLNGIFAVLLLGTSLYFAGLILTERICFGQGDASMRVLVSLDYSRHLGQMIASPQFFNSPWNPGQFIMQGIAIKALRCVGIDTPGGICKFLLLASVLAWAIGILMISRAARVQAGPFVGSLVGLALIGLPSLLDLAASGMSEIYTFAIIAGAVYCLWLGLKGNDRYIYAAALLLLLANFYRNETLLFNAAVALVLVVRRRFAQAAILTAVSSFYFGLKLGYLLLFERGREVTFLNWGKCMPWGVRPQSALYQEALLLVGRFWALNGVYLACLAGIFVAVAIAAWIATRRAKPIATPVIPWLFFGSALFAFLVFSTARGTINAQVRYMFLAASFLATALSSGSGAAVSLLHEKRSELARESALMAILITAGLSAASVIHFIDRQQHTPDSVIQTVDWIQAHGKGKPVAFDFLMWWEQPLLLYTLDATQDNRSFCYSYGKISQDPEILRLLNYPPKANPKNPVERVQADVTKLVSCFHHHLVANRPEFVVMASDKKFHRDIKRMNPPPSRHSYFRPFLEPIEHDKFRLKSPYVKPEVDVMLTRVFKSSMFWVYRVDVQFEKKTTDCAVPKRVVRAWEN